MKKRILHLLPEEKITDNIIHNFSSLSNENLFLIYKKNSIELIENDIKISLNFDIDFKDFIEKKEVSGILIHGLFPVFFKYILKIPDDLKIGWFVWGFDIYNQDVVKKYLYAPLTKSMFYSYKERFKSKIYGNKFLKLLYSKITRKPKPILDLDNVFNKINYFCSYIREDYEFFIKNFNTNVEFVDVPFCSIDQYLSGNENLRINKDAHNILLGNSNSKENNHIDAIKILFSQKLQGQVIVPLSYGNNEHYKMKVMEFGLKNLPDNFFPLVDFMDRNAYLDILKSCSTAIFYHYRQQAMGNIIALLYMGARVYLSSNNPVYKYCKRIGLHVYDFDIDFKKYQSNKLESKAADENRMILQRHFNEAVVFEKMNNLISLL